jgi:hypothetical protein
MMRLLIVAVLAAAGAWFTYWRLERLGSRAWVAASARGIAWAALGLLILNLTCAAPSPQSKRPLILLDGSLSMTAAGGHWREALDSARAWGEVRLFGDAGVTPDSLPMFGRSDLGPALAAAAASDRRAIVVTDGEITDQPNLAPEALGRVGIRTFPRTPQADLAIVRVSGPARVTVGDTIRLELEVRGFGSTTDSARLEVRSGDRVLARRSVRLGKDGQALVSAAFPSVGLSGDALFTVALVNPGDAEPRDDVRLWLVTVTPTPGIVMLASPSDWDGRFLFRTLRDVADLPIRGYTRFEAGRWRSMETLAPVSAGAIAQAARRADVLVIKGAARDFVRESRARGVWDWPSGEGGETEIVGEWYVTAPAASPLGSAFLGMPVDSFPPLIEITPIEPAQGDWVGLTAQLARRGADRPVFTGHVLGGRRRVTTAADGLWRWAFRGGASEQAYRALVAATLSWLLGASDSTQARARPVRPVVPNGRPVVFEWAGAGAAVPIGITLTGEGAVLRDTLRFDGSGRAIVSVPAGRYGYTLDGGGGGVVAVEVWSDEWLPRLATLASREAPAVSLAGVTSTRGWVWLFGLAIVALATEWLARRRLGLR